MAQMFAAILEHSTQVEFELISISVPDSIFSSMFYIVQLFNSFSYPCLCRVVVAISVWEIDVS